MSHHTHREDLIGEHKYGDLGQLILLILFLVVWILDSFIFKYTTFPNGYASLLIRLPLALIVFYLGIYLAKAGHDIIFGEVREKPGVVDHGVFGKTRHPLYLAAILFYVGLLLLSFSIIAASVWLIIVVFYNFIALHEEKMLTEAFGDEYTTYMIKVPRWLPKLKL